MPQSLDEAPRFNRRLLQVIKHDIEIPGNRKSESKQPAGSRFSYFNEVETPEKERKKERKKEQPQLLLLQLFHPQPGSKLDGVDLPGRRFDDVFGPGFCSGRCPDPAEDGRRRECRGRGCQVRDREPRSQGRRRGFFFFFFLAAVFVSSFFAAVAVAGGVAGCGCGCGFPAAGHQAAAAEPHDQPRLPGRLVRDLRAHRHRADRSGRADEGRAGSGGARGRCAHLPREGAEDGGGAAGRRTRGRQEEEEWRRRRRRSGSSRR